MQPARLLLRYWLPVVLYVALIFTVSAQPHLHAPVEFKSSDKIYHCLEYGVLGWLLARAFAATRTWVRLVVPALIAIAIGVTIAASDELFQSTVPGRESSALDAAADTIGFAAAQWLFWRRRKTTS